MGRGADSLSAALGDILGFFTDLHASGKSYSTINLHRSALSGTLDAIDGFSVGEHPLVIKLLKGCYQLNPPRPKYDSIWDTNQVWAYMSSLGEDQYLSVDILVGKLTSLLALTTLMRVSDLAAIDYRSVKFEGDGVKFALRKLRKAQRSGALKSFALSKSRNSVLCPVQTLKEFLERTSRYRSPSNEESLLIALIAPHKPVSTNTVSRWIKSFLKRAGIDTASFGAHSTRSAAASQAVDSGTPVESVLRAGNWASEATFNRFYNRSSARNVQGHNKN